MNNIVEDNEYNCPECHCTTPQTYQLCENPYIEDVIHKLTLLNSTCCECGKNKCEIWCVQCNTELCHNCSDRIHTFRTNKSHERQYIRKMRTTNKVFLFDINLGMWRTFWIYLFTLL